MSYFERPPDGGEQPTGHDVETAHTPEPYWASGPFAESEPEHEPGLARTRPWGER